MASVPSAAMRPRRLPPSLLARRAAPTIGRPAVRSRPSLGIAAAAAAVARPSCLAPAIAISGRRLSTTGGAAKDEGGDRSSFDDGREISSPPFSGDALFPSPTDRNLRVHGMPLLARAAHHARRGRALAYCDLRSSGSGGGGDGDGRIAGRSKRIEHSYHDILSISTRLHDFFVAQRKGMPAAAASAAAADTNAPPQRIAFLCPPGPLYVATMFAAWSSGSVAVPLCVSHKRAELAYVLKDSDPAFVLDGTSALEEGRELRLAARDAGAMGRYWCLDDVLASHPPPRLGASEGTSSEQTRQSSTEGESGGAGHTAGSDGAKYALGANGHIPSKKHPALIIYTSGTTGNPKGVVHTHENLYHQVTDLVTSWGWTSNDSILHFLPLHHVHGGMFHGISHLV